MRAVWLHTLTQTIDFGENKQKIFAKLLKIVHSSLAQSVEHAAVNRRVVGSSPTGGATQSPISGGFFISTKLYFVIFIPNFAVISNFQANDL